MRCPGCHASLIEIGIGRRARLDGVDGSDPTRREVLVVCPHWQAILPADRPGSSI